MGDFNEAADTSTAYDALVRAGLHDALAPRDRPARRRRTFIGLDQDQDGEGEQIDWLFTTSDVTVQDAWVDAGPPDAATASDHRPVVADIQLPQ